MSTSISEHVRQEEGRRGIASEAAEKFRVFRTPQHRWDQDTATHDTLIATIEEAIDSATAAKEMEIKELGEMVDVLIGDRERLQARVRELSEELSERVLGEGEREELEARIRELEGMLPSEEERKNNAEIAAMMGGLKQP